jgi:hypothetical protein
MYSSPQCMYEVFVRFDWTSRVARVVRMLKMKIQIAQRVVYLCECITSLMAMYPATDFCCLELPYKKLYNLRELEFC